MVKVDIKKFFPSVTINTVKRFFLQTMECSPDVAALLSKVLTVYGHLATGSSVSPILSYYAHRDMFEEIAHLSAGRGAVMTCYVDDMCFSGKTITRKFLSDVRVIIRSHGLKSHKIHYFSSNTPRIVTGVVVTNSGIKLPNIRHKKIVDGYAQLQADLSDEEKFKLLRSLIGRINEAAQIDPRWTPKAKQLTLEMKKIEPGMSKSGFGRNQARSKSRASKFDRKSRFSTPYVKSPKNSDAGATPETSRWSLARVQAT